jgi:hypothetical protein
MRGLSTAFLVTAALLPAPARAEALDVRNGQLIHVELAGHRQAASALRARPDGWRLDLARLRGTLRLQDVTAGATPATMEISLAGAAVVLDRDRFRPDHAYRIELRQGLRIVGAALIYLKPQPRNRSIRFDEREAASGDGDMAPLAKGTL